MKKLYGAAGACVLALMLASCHDDARAAWDKVLKKCATSDLNGPTILYFGPSNAVGSGSIWRKDNQGTFHVVWDLAHMPDPKDFLAPFTPNSCAGSVETNSTMGLNASLDAQPISADLKADLQKATSVQTEAKFLAWEPIAEGPYRNYVNSPAAAGLRPDLATGDKYILWRALKVSGFSMTLEFKSADGVQLAAKYNGKLSNAVAGNIGGGLTASWSGTTKLTLSSDGAFYIAGEFEKYPFGPAGFARIPVPVPRNARAVLDRR